MTKRVTDPLKSGCGKPVAVRLGPHSESGIDAPDARALRIVPESRANRQ